MKKVLGFTLVSFIATVIMELTSCNRCGPFDVHNFRIIRFKNYLIKDQNDSIAENDTVNINNLKMIIFADSVKTVMNKNIHLPLSFFNNAYACSPAFPVSVNAIKNIEIFSDKDLTTSISSTQNLANYFKVGFGTANYTLSAFLSNEEGARKFYGEIFSLQINPYSLDVVNLNKTYHQFTVKLYFSDNTIESFVFNKIYLTI